MSARSWTYLAILLGLVFHGALLPFTHGQTYDAYIHMFFGDHYARSWFDPWEPRWYTGFTVTAYPPGSHQILGLLIRIMDMRIAFIILQLAAVALLIIGIYRFSRLWVNDMAAAYAAILCVFSSSISETLHIFGQLPTLLSISLFLNAIPHISAWIDHGRKSDFCLGAILTAATTSVHHVTPLFGTIFFVAPIGIAALLANLKRRQYLNPAGVWGYAKWAMPPIMRGLVMGVTMLILIVTIVFPYWHWSITDPITQVSIPHGSRENFLAKPNLGLMFFIIPWGLLIFVIPYVIAKSIRSALWPLGLSVLMGLFLGTGGTSPLPKIILGPAFEILTLDRFTFWASLLILPFAGLAVQSLWNGRAHTLVTYLFGSFISRISLTISMLAYVAFALMIALLPKVQPTQPDFIDPAPIIKFMDEDNHSNWRYLTLGFGDQFAYHSALIDAESVDGNYHSARRLPSLMNYSVERLENSKYMGVPGLASLNQFLTNAEKFHLKYIFSNDEFYDPVLHYTGWNPVTRLNNGIRVWEKPDISPMPSVRPRRDLPKYQRYMWGILPIGALILGFVTLIGLAATQRLISIPSESFFAPSKDKIAPVMSGPVIWLIRALPVTALFISSAMMAKFSQAKNAIRAPDEVVSAFYEHLDFRENTEAFDLIAPNPDIDYGQFLRIQKLTGGLVPSFGKLTAVRTLSITQRSDETATIETQLQYLTALGHKMVSVKTNLVKTANGRWKIIYDPPEKGFADRIVNADRKPQFRDLTGAILNTPLDPVQRLARPEIDILESRLVENKGRFYVIGRLKNTSALPTCAKVVAYIRDDAQQKSLGQHSGRLGAHRLLPGESSAFRIDFEGYMKLQDRSVDAGYDPEQFSLPEFDQIPSNLDVMLSTTACAPAYYKSLNFTDMSLSNLDIAPNIQNNHQNREKTRPQKQLDVTIANIGTEIVSTVQIKLSYLDEKARLIWVEPFYLQNNLIPGETRRVQIPVSDDFGTILDTEPITENNGQIYQLKTESQWPLSLNLPDYDQKIFLDYDAMIYRPLD